MADLFKILEKSFCNQIFYKEIEYGENKVNMYILIRDLQRIDNKYVFSGIRISGYIFFGNRKVEISDIEYKRFIGQDGIINNYIDLSLWLIIANKLKHFNIEKSECSVKELYFLKTARFLKHTKKFSNTCNFKN